MQARSASFPWNLQQEARRPYVRAPVCQEDIQFGTVRVPPPGHTEAAVSTAESVLSFRNPGLPLAGRAGGWGLGGEGAGKKQRRKRRDAWAPSTVWSGGTVNEEAHCQHQDALFEICGKEIPELKTSSGRMTEISRDG